MARKCGTLPLILFFLPVGGSRRQKLPLPTRFALNQATGDAFLFCDQTWKAIVFPPGDGRLYRDHFDGQHFLDLMIAGDHRVQFVQRGGVEISLTALAAHFRRHIFDDVKPPVEPVLLSNLPLDPFAIAEFAFHAPAPFFINSNDDQIACLQILILQQKLPNGGPSTNGPGRSGARGRTPP